MATAVARRRNTLWARRKREAKLDRERQSRRTCPRRFGRFGVCRGVLETIVLPGGGWRVVCPRCERFAAGICLDCDRPVQGTVRKARRCAYHQSVERLRAPRRHREQHRAEINRRAKLRARQRAADPVLHALDCAKKKAWRARNVVRVKLSKRKWRLNPNRPNGYSSREKFQAYHRAYQLAHGLTLTAPETLMRGVERAIAVLERAANKTREKLQGVEQLQAELAGIERALGELRGVLEVEPTRRRRGVKAA